MKDYTNINKGVANTLNGNLGSALPPKKKSKNARVRNENIAGLIMGGIPVIGRILFTFIPMVMALAMAFFKMPRMNTFEGADFVGFDNFAYVFKDPNFWKSVGNTGIYMLTLPIILVVSVLLASALNANVKGKGIFRVILMIPYICSTVAIVFVFKWLYNTNYGVLNSLLGTKVGWLTDSPGLFRLSLMMMMVWSGCGYRMLLLTASLTSVNVSYYEAAELDGANAIHKFFHITVPAISPTLFFLLVTGCAGSLQVFAESQVMASDGGQSVGYAGLTIVFYLYREGFVWNNMGVASAAALILSMMIFILTILNFKLSNKWVRYD